MLPNIPYYVNLYDSIMMVTQTGFTNLAYFAPGSLFCLKQCQHFVERPIVIRILWGKHFRSCIDYCTSSRCHTVFYNPKSESFALHTPGWLCCRTLGALTSRWMMVNCVFVENFFDEISLLPLVYHGRSLYEHSLTGLESQPLFSGHSMSPGLDLGSGPSRIVKHCFLLHCMGANLLLNFQQFQSISEIEAFMLLFPAPCSYVSAADFPLPSLAVTFYTS